MEKHRISPVLLYYRLNDSNEVLPNSVTVRKFERDLRQLLDAGYESISIADIVEARRNASNFKENCFSIVFQGGYLDNYTLAFPLLKQLNIHADIFIDPDFVGKNVDSEDTDFIPRFSWNQAEEMQQSGLVDIYSFWNPSDSDDCPNLASEVQRRINMIQLNIENSKPKTSFYINTNRSEIDRLDAVYKNGVKSYILAFWLMNFEKLSKGAIPYTCVNQESNIFDVIDEFTVKCKSMLTKEADTLNNEPIVDLWSPENHESIELQIDANPQVKNYLRHAFPLSIISANRKEKAEVFALYEYIDVIFRPWYHLFDYDNHMYDSWDALLCYKISRDVMTVNKYSVIDYIINGISAGYYCDMWVDTFYIPGKTGYGEFHMTHCMLVYGYDKDLNIFKSLTYTQGGKYERLDISPFDIQKSCSTDYFSSLHLIKVNKESQITYKLDALIERLERYINSKYDLCVSGKYYKYDNNQLCNRNACEAFPQYLVDNANTEKMIHTVAIYSFLEHKRCMGWRLKYILQHEGMSDPVVDDYEVYSRKMYEIGINMALKYNMTHREQVLMHLNEKLIELNEKEYRAITRIIEIFKGRIGLNTN